jgi:hypothetical protein
MGVGFLFGPSIVRVLYSPFPAGAGAVPALERKIERGAFPQAHADLGPNARTSKEPHIAK